MASMIQERYRPIPLAANSVTKMEINGLGGFLCTVSGTIAVTDSQGVVVIAATAVTAGVYLPLPFAVGGGRVGQAATTDARKTTITLAGGAAGTLGVF